MSSQGAMSAEPDDFANGQELDGEVQDGAGGDGADINNAQAVSSSRMSIHSID